MEKGHIILLNGTSSSGKSTLSWELQSQSAEEYYWLSNDAFTDMPHNSYYDRDRTKTYATAISMLFKTAMLFLSNGINVIIDHVMLDDESGKSQELLDCVETLRDAHVLFVFVSCPLDELNRRELARQDRAIGLAKSQYEKLLPEDFYDIVVDTCANTTEECARQILRKQQSMIQNNEPTAFDRMKKRYGHI